MFIYDSSHKRISYFFKHVYLPKNLLTAEIDKESLHFNQVKCDNTGNSLHK